MTDIALKCQCGSVKGRLSLASAKNGNHVVCYCVDCQAFARQLSKQDSMLDGYGGTEVYQTAPWNVVIDEGEDQLRCLRLTPKGLNRWYTACCNTAVANTLSAKLPFLGLIYSFIDVEDRDQPPLGPVLGYHKLESATGEVSSEIREKGMPKRVTMRVFWNLAKWKLTAGGKTNPLFRADGKAISKPTVVSPAE